jgi:hypothetical protein
MTRKTALPPRLLHRDAIKLAVTPTQPTSFHKISHRLCASFPTAKKRGQRNKFEKQEGVVEHMWRRLSSS